MMKAVAAAGMRIPEQAEVEPGSPFSDKDAHAPPALRAVTGPGRGLVPEQRE